MDFNLFVRIIWCVCLFQCVTCITIKNNAYKEISISFSEQTEEAKFKFDKLKEVLRLSSKYLYHATRKRAYFEEFILILPPSWTSKSFCSEYTKTSPDKIDVYITNSTVSLKAQHSRGCGLEGDIMYMSPDWLDGDIQDLARQFVQQWSTYRYGVFEENPLDEGSCFASSENSWSPVGCYDVNIPPNWSKVFDDNGLVHCDPPKEDLKSSLMYQTKASKALDYCDGSQEYPHNPAMPTLHNNLCEGQTVWSIIKNSSDFKYPENLPSTLLLPPTTSFKCLQQETLQLTLAIQISSTSPTFVIREVFPQIIVEIRYTFYHFLKNLLPKNTQIRLLTLSETTHSEILDLEDDKKLSEALKNVEPTPFAVPDLCLVCGIREALNFSQPSAHPSVSVVIAFESALKNEKVSDLVKVVQDHSQVKLHLVLIKDTETDATTVELISALKANGGSLHALPKPYSSSNTLNVVLNSQLNIVLSEVMRNPLQIDSSILVVHEKVYENQETIEDQFVTPPIREGKLVYFMHCLRGFIKEFDENCIDLQDLSATYKCGQVKELNGEMFKTWTYKFSLRTGIGNSTCVSTALVYKLSSSETVSLRGWLNELVIVPGQNALIIYAEVTGVETRRIVQVLAHISGPSSENEYEIELRDSGNGDPDVKVGDGIYSRYFTSFNEKGLYDVTVLVKLTTSEENKISNDESKNSAETITYKKVIGFFNVASMPKPGIDVSPPNRIADLKVVAVNHENRTVTFQWTAPGNDYDSGTATKYEIKISPHPSYLTELYFNGATLLESEQEPQSGGEVEIRDITLPKNFEDINYYVALRGIDSARNKGKISNIVQIHIKPSSTLTSESYTTSTMVSSTSRENDFNVTHNNTTPGEQTTSSVPEISSTPTNKNGTDITTSISWEDMLHSEKFIIVVSSFGGLLLLLVIIIIIICCCHRKKIRKMKNENSKKNSLRPPYNLNVAYQEESQSVHQSESGFSLTSLADRSIYSSASPKVGRRENSRYSYHTTKSLQNKSQLDSDSELGFKLVEALPTQRTRTLSRFARRLKEDGEIDESPIAQPQKPPSDGETQMYSLGIV